MRVLLQLPAQTDGHSIPLDIANFRDTILSYPRIKNNNNNARVIQQHEVQRYRGT